MGDEQAHRLCALCRGDEVQTKVMRRKVDGESKGRVGKKQFRQKVQSGQTGENNTDVIRTYEGQRIRRGVNRNKSRFVSTMQMTAVVT